MILELIKLFNNSNYALFRKYSMYIRHIINLNPLLTHSNLSRDSKAHTPSNTASE